MAKTNDDAIRTRVAAQFAKVADRSATLDMCIEGVILALIAVEDQLCALPDSQFSEAVSRVLDGVHSNIVLARMALRGAKYSSSPTEDLMSLVNNISADGGRA